MNRQAASCTSKQQLLAIALTAAIWVGMPPRAGSAKSLYVITERVNFGLPIPIHAYDIGPDGGLTFQTASEIPYQGAGTVGLAVDAESESLFVTYERSNRIQVIDARTMKPGQIAAASRAESVVGVVYDHDEGLLYCIDGSTANLYVYRWDPATSKLRHVTGSPFTLEGVTGRGIALDEVNDELYVAGGGLAVRVYKTADFSLARTISLRRPAIRVAVDSARGNLYYGAGDADNLYLSQVDLASGSERDVQVAPDAGVMGLAVDIATGFVYVTTGRTRQPGGDDLLVFDAELALVDTIEDIGNPTGVAIPRQRTGYNPLNLAKQVNPPAAGELADDEVRYVEIGGQLTYSVCFDQGDKTLSGVRILDTLPPEAAFVTATGDGIYGRYDAASHTYLWQDPPRSPKGRTCLEIVVQLDAATPSGTVVTNAATVDTDQTPPTTTGVDVVATGNVFEPLNLGKLVVQEGVDTTPPAFAKPGEEVTFEICFNNNRNEEAVTNVLLVDHLPAGMTFVSADGEGDFGTYDPSTNTFAWTYDELGGHHSGCVELVARVGTDVPLGTILFNVAIIDSDQTVRTSSGAEVNVSLNPLLLSKTIGSGGVEDPNNPGVYLVAPGENVTYLICCTNPAVDEPIRGVTIVDTLPKQVTFLGADGEGDFAQYDPKSHTVTWVFDSLKPQTQICLELMVQVAPITEPGVVITNRATVTGEESISATTQLDLVVRESPIKAQLYLRPDQIVRTAKPTGTGIAAIVHLPFGLGAEQIADAPLVLNPGQIRASSQTIYGTAGQGKVLATFDEDAFLAATRGYGQVEVEVSGMLNSGRAFVGNGVIEIAKFGGP